jgi:hypothetical protein
MAERGTDLDALLRFGATDAVLIGPSIVEANENVRSPARAVVRHHASIRAAVRSQKVDRAVSIFAAGKQRGAAQSQKGGEDSGAQDRAASYGLERNRRNGALFRFSRLWILVLKLGGGRGYASSDVRGARGLGDPALEIARLFLLALDHADHLFGVLAQILTGHLGDRATAPRQLLPQRQIDVRSEQTLFDRIEG